MCDFTVFDNPEFKDRYTVFIGTDVYAMSDHPNSPQGLNMYIGPKGNFEIKYLGTKVERRDVPDSVLEAIKIKGE